MLTVYEFSSVTRTRMQTIMALPNLCRSIYDTSLFLFSHAFSQTRSFLYLFFSSSTPLFLFSFLSLSLNFLIRFCSLSSRYRLFRSCPHFISTFTLTRRQLVFLSYFLSSFLGAILYISLHTSSALFLLFDYLISFVYFSLRLSNSLISLLNPN
ncbi:unnamed protein product [Acanthosepion pharaonis]|uniref:Uncharacterized protein n=1 Tax=Acanthosepion pharaonis TaxID=158019 RepID=A0A812DV84_ACAPH|nr:unnamed protein product [Sepia pharaonis]